MKNQTPGLARRIRKESAFTLIELLVVIAVISILAALIFPITGAVNRAKMRSKARAELAQIQNAIESYKAKLGHYPPDNPGNPTRNPLYFELLGTTNAGTAANPLYITLDGTARLTGSQFGTVFGPNVSGFVNCTQPGGSDEGRTAIAFLHDLKPGQSATLSNPPAKFLVCSVPLPATTVPAFLGQGSLTPFYYVSSTPTNNPSTYDLWVDIMIGGQTNRIANWSDKPIIP
jgi:prepilin-type N-terminal cleavage/methylation domain-containing protein